MTGVATGFRPVHRTVGGSSRIVAASVGCCSPLPGLTGASGLRLLGASVSGGRMLVSRVRVRRRSSSRSVAGGRSGSSRSSGRVAVQALVGLGVLAVVATGCQSNPKPPPLETASSSSATPTPSPTEAAPTLPAEAKGTSEAAAKAFVRHYFDVINHAAESGEVNALEELSDAKCTSCSAIRENIDEIYSAGGEIRSDGWTLLGIRVIRAGRGSAVASLDVELEPETVVRSSGGKSVHNQGSRQPMTIFLSADSGSWLVTRLDLVS